jgi:putative adhesin
MKLALMFLALISIVLPAGGQMRTNRDKQLTCNNSYSSRPRVCDLQETTIGPVGMLDIQPGHNGGIEVKGWDQNSVLVRARLEAWAESDAEARALLSQVRVEAGGGQIRAVGPDTYANRPWDQNRQWVVSFEIFTPWNTNMKLESHNGGISLSDVRGRIEIESHNGGVKLTRVAGDIVGSTHNGGIQVELEGATWDGRQLELSTHNGAVTLSVPAAFSASIETRTERGRLNSDFPISVRGRIDEGNLNFNIGAGGPLIKLSTHNGGIRVRRL